MPRLEEKKNELEIKKKKAAVQLETKARPCPVRFFFVFCFLFFFLFFFVLFFFCFFFFFKNRKQRVAACTQWIRIFFFLKKRIGNNGQQHVHSGLWRGHFCTIFSPIFSSIWGDFVLMSRGENFCAPPKFPPPPPYNQTLLPTIFSLSLSLSLSLFFHPLYFTSNRTHPYGKKNWC